MLPSLESQKMNDATKKSGVTFTEEKKEVIVYTVNKKGGEKSSMVAPLVQQIIADNEQREK